MSKRKKIKKDVEGIINQIIPLGPDHPLWKVVEDLYTEASDGLFDPQWFTIEEDDIDNAMKTSELKELYYNLVKLLPIK